jgi:hypothetical protein
MNVAAVRIPVIASSDRARDPRGWALLAAASADAVAAGLLLVGTPLATPLEGAAVAVLHGAAILLVSGSARALPSRQWLCVAATLTVPFLGAAVAAAAVLTRGRAASASGRKRRAHPRPALRMAAIQRIGSSLSPCDALTCGNGEQRRAALVALSLRADSESIALLRRAASGSDPDLALSAALVLDEISERAERRLEAAAAAAAVLTRGRAASATGGKRTHRLPALRTAAIRRIGSALSHCDALPGGVDEQRCAALPSLSLGADTESIPLPRRAASARDLTCRPRGWMR